MTTPTLFIADLAGPAKPLRQPCQWCVGSGHATPTLRADWQAQLAQAHRDLGFRYVRFRGILDDTMGTLICRSDALLHSFFNPDRIFDFLLSIGMKPVVELSFMPRTLSSGVTIERVDEDHANPEAAWHAIGSPEYPTPTQVMHLNEVSEVTSATVPFRVVGNGLEIDLPAPQSVDRLRVAWRRT